MHYQFKFLLGLFVLFLASTLLAQAQKTIRGAVTDASTEETLPSANISIEDTYRGTISNRNGIYVLSIPDSLLPATVVVRYLGYHTIRREITATSDETQNFDMEPSVLELEEITVTGEDPAVRIMREVIKRKQVWRQRLDTYRAEAYTRQSISNDTSIVVITESVSEAFWHKEKGHREVLKSRRQTANLEASENFAGVSYFPNFYDDNIEIAGFDVVGVTHPDALKYYQFKLEGHKNLDDRVVYEISVAPDRKLQPLFEGTVWVLDDEYALLEVSLQPNDVVTFPPPIKDFNTYYQQQFNNYGREFWLPMDMRIDGDIKIAMVGLEFPLIRFHQVSQIKNYVVNVPIPDSLYKQKDLFTVDSTYISSDSLMVSAIESVPLTRAEQQAYETLDSTATLEKAFKPTGFFARFVDMDGDGENDSNSGILSKIPGDLSPAIRFNRVDELYLGLTYDIRPFKKIELRVDGGYSTGYEEAGYGAGFTYQPVRLSRFRTSVGLDYRAHTVPLYTSKVYIPAFTVISNLFGEPDYFDYYRSEGVRLFTKVEFPRKDLSAEIGFNSYEHSSLSVNSAYDILGRDQIPLINPPVDEGTLQSLDIRFGYNLNEGYNLGVSGLKRIRFQIEYSDDPLGSDHDFTRYLADIDWTFPTFYQRRFLSNTLDLKLTAGTSSGDLPIQKLGIIDGAIQHFSPFGSLKTLQDRPYQGEHFLMLNAEHNFRSIPFELVGLRKPVDWNWGLIIFSGAGKTWMSDSRKQSFFNNTGYLINETEDIHWEAGVSLNGLFGLFRVDFAQRLDEPAFVVNFSVARIF